MRVYLIRHGRAKSKQQDPLRHLTDEGAAEARRVAEFLRPLNLPVEALWHSDKLRARETAEILASAVTSKQGLTAHEGLGPDDDVRPIHRDLERAGGDVMIIGHLPFLAKLTGLLLAGDESAGGGALAAFEPAALLCLERDEDRTWRIAWMVRPDLLTI